MIIHAQSQQAVSVTQNGRDGVRFSMLSHKHSYPILSRRSCSGNQIYLHKTGGERVEINNQSCNRFININDRPVQITNNVVLICTQTPQDQA